MSEAAAGQPSYAAVHTEVEQQAHRSWFSRNRPKLIAAMLWILLIAAYQWYVHANQLGQLDALRRLVDVMQTSLYGPLIFIGIYTLRPLIFFSAIVLTVLGGFLFGPFWGIVYTVIGANASATLAYFIGRYFGVGALESDGSNSLVQRYANRMRANSFETVLIMRFIFLPFDLVNYSAGFLRIGWTAFILATILGSIPGTISFTLFGASIDGDFGGSLPSADPWVLAASVGIFVVSLGLSRYIKRRERARSADADIASATHQSDARLA